MRQSLAVSEILPRDRSGASTAGSGLVTSDCIYTRRNEETIRLPARQRDVAVAGCSSFNHGSAMADISRRRLRRLLGEPIGGPTSPTGWQSGTLAAAIDEILGSRDVSDARRSTTTCWVHVSTPRQYICRTDFDRYRRDCVHSWRHRPISRAYPTALAQPCWLSLSSLHSLSTVGRSERNRSSLEAAVASLSCAHNIIQSRVQQSRTDFQLSSAAGR